MRRISKSRAGFTILELLISTTLGAIVMASVLSTYIFIGRNLARISSYQALESESRKALAYLTRDFMQAQSVKGGTTPTSSSVALVLPNGEVTYTYDPAAKTLRRQATFGGITNLVLLQNTLCECTTFRFLYFTSTDTAPTDQATATVNVPYSIKQIQASFLVESPASWTAETRARYEIASSRYLLRNRGAPDGT